MVHCSEIEIPLCWLPNCSESQPAVHGKQREHGEPEQPSSSARKADFQQKEEPSHNYRLRKSSKIDFPFVATPHGPELVILGVATSVGVHEHIHITTMLRNPRHCLSESVQRH